MDFASRQANRVYSMHIVTNAFMTEKNKEKLSIAPKCTFFLNCGYQLSANFTTPIKPHLCLKFNARCSLLHTVKCK